MLPEPTQELITQPKALIYARVSSTKQVEEGHGLDSQETRCRDYAIRKGYEVVDVYQDIRQNSQRK